ncbi:RNA polymerase subunit sigma [Vibrio ponticus]|uniref:RNA polymerase subunit sigma n=1 Tax=Vibrio ponticus TaxID=265668 RepID=A0ABX3FRT9_9VIBR|nr:ECF-type sigma factor [Vibrio ponticus]OLQ95919.1 RNA polymerase subunit sigma [Vibrio ponticus]
MALPNIRDIEKRNTEDKQSDSQLYQFIYFQLRKIAQQERERCALKHGEQNKVLLDSVNSTTALVHDAYVKLSQSDNAELCNQREFYLMAAKAMRQILIDNARIQLAQKRQAIVETDEFATEQLSFEELLLVDKVLDVFSDSYLRQSNALKLKYFMGMTNDEIGQLLHCSSSLVEKDLRFSKSWLQARMA